MGTSLGYSVFQAEDGEEGLDEARENRPDLIILDVMMPVLDGYEVCKRLRREGDTTPILMLTVKDKELDKVLGLELGADDYVTKPFSLREVVARVKAILRRTEEKQDEIGRFGIVIAGIWIDIDDDAVVGFDLDAGVSQPHHLTDSAAERNTVNLGDVDLFEGAVTFMNMHDLRRHELRQKQ